VKLSKLSVAAAEKGNLTITVDPNTYRIMSFNATETRESYSKGEKKPWKTETWKVSGTKALPVKEGYPHEGVLVCQVAGEEVCDYVSCTYRMDGVFHGVQIWEESAKCCQCSSGSVLEIVLAP
jgi:hypothetical protein